VKQATESLVGRADVIYIPKDNTVVAALETVIQVAEKNKIPLFVGEKDSVKRGGFASYGFEYFDLGYATGKMAVDILKNGKKPADIPVGFPDTLDLAINMKAAKNEGVEVTQSMKDKVKDKKNIIE
jgi:putative ABC transport system substrate-binding protein